MKKTMKTMWANIKVAIAYWMIDTGKRMVNSVYGAPDFKDSMREIVNA